MAEKYQSVNRAWPEGTNDGRDIKPTDQEAMAAARRLYRIAMGRPFKGTIKLTSGNRFTRVRRGVLCVNPNYRGGGWHELVHGISHHASWRLHHENHGPRHAFIERELIHAVVSKGWLDGKLRRDAPEKPKPDAKAVRHARVLAGIKRWQAKQRRATTALRKLARQRAYYEREAAQSAH